MAKRHLSSCQGIDMLHLVKRCYQDVMNAVPAAVAFAHCESDAAPGCW